MLLTLPFKSLHQILRLGIARGVVRRWERLIYVRTAALSASVPVVDNSTLRPYHLAGALRLGFSLVGKCRE